MQELLHRLRREVLGGHELAAQVGRRGLRRRLQPQQDRRQRLIDLVVEVLREALSLLFLRSQHAARGVPALGLEAVEHAVEGALEADDLLGVGPRGLGAPGPRREISLLGGADQAGERPEPAAQEQGVGQQRHQQRQDEHEELAALAGIRHGQVDGHGGEEDRGRHQQRVDRQDLAEQREPLHAMNSGPEGQGRRWGLDPISPERRPSDTSAASKSTNVSARRGRRP